MQLILMRGPFSRTNVFSINTVHLVICLALLVLFVSLFTVIGICLAVRHGAALPFVHNSAYSTQLVKQYNLGETGSPLDAMAIRLAEMRAQLARLDATSARLLKSNGMDNTKAMFVEQPGQGGMRQKDEKSLSFQEMNEALLSLSNQIERQADVFSILDSDFRTARVKSQSISTEAPLSNIVAVSNFGHRIDPFTGRRAIHEGVDFMAPTGTPILAAAAGVVRTSGWHPGYGNMVEIEHSGKTTTRYGHASKLLVKAGDIVRLGQTIALVGSTGRSTGPHLHFEVRVNGVAFNPSQFLEKNGLPRPGPSTVAALNGLFAENASTPLE